MTDSEGWVLQGRCSKQRAMGDSFANACVNRSPVAATLSPSTLGGLGWANSEGGRDGAPGIRQGDVAKERLGIHAERCTPRARELHHDLTGARWEQNFGARMAETV
ncbi:hypothetical protein PMIN01_07198 [Paraphaeosphaeria minitans]|uniref:Uncharacterized protein n=1 Tax=Paraphaeosphaeria minitans TaxID=565426 RepID=A0A9P6GFY9_9PLEO|nr:hypothetical protein PMIN01_07198 [Paraphaeosphaeria minitans]